MDLSQLLSDFQQNARQLNEASDSINTIITDIEQKMVSANAGLQYWLEEDTLNVTEPKVHKVLDKSGDVKLFAQWSETHLGFVKLTNEGWHLAFRERTASASEDEDGKAGAPTYETVKVDALWKAPRDIRIKALELMPRLVYHLNEAVAIAVRTIQQAKESV